MSHAPSRYLTPWQRFATGTRAVLLCWIVTLLGFAAAAHACPACAPGSGKSRNIYIASTVGLSLLPILMIGFGTWFLRRAAGGGARKESGQCQNENAGTESRRFHE